MDSKVISLTLPLFLKKGEAAQAHTMGNEQSYAPKQAANLFS